MKLTAFKYGVTEINERMAFQDGNENVKLPIALLFFLIEADDKKILVDVGCDTMPGFELKEFISPVKVLEEYGVKRTEITDIILTHSHHDHIDALRYYDNARIHLHENEINSARSYIPNMSQLQPIKENKIISKGVEFRFIGGHSSGSGIVKVENNDEIYVLCGDECYTKENFLYGKPTGSSYNLINSEKFIQEYRKEKYIPVLFHDPDIVADIGYKTLF